MGVLAAGGFLGAMSAITSRSPAGRLAGRRFGLLNGVLLALLAGAGVAAYLVVGGTSTGSRPAARTATVGRGVVLSTVSATGTLRAATSLSVGFASAGTLVSVAVEAGQHVRAGQVLGRIDPFAAEQGVRQAEAALATAQAQYRQTLTGETPQQRRQDALSIEQARQTLATAKATAARDRKQSAASVAQAERQLGIDQGQEKVDLAQRTKDRTPYATVDAAEAVVAADEAALAAAQATQHDDQQGRNPQLAADEAALTSAQTRQYSDQQKQLELQHQLNMDKANGAADSQIAADDNQLDAIAQQLSVDAHAVTLAQSALSADQSAIANADSYAVSQANAKLSADQASLSALQADEKAIRADEAKILSDRQALASARSTAAATAAKDAQSVASAELALRTARASVATKQAPPTAAEIATATASVVQARGALAAARRTLAETTLRAPIAGVVAAVNGVVGTTVAGGGSSVSSASSTSGSGSGSASPGFVTLTRLTGLQLVASFAETDAVRLRAGQAATVTADPIPNRKLAARVVAIAPTAASSSSGVVTYDVTFALRSAPALLKPGMTANVDVIAAEQDGVLTVPTSAVTGSGRNATVTVLRDGEPRTVPVVAGLRGDSSTAIVGGDLKAGDRVVLPTVSLGSQTGGSAGGTLGGRGARGGGRGRFLGGGFGG